MPAVQPEPVYDVFVSQRKSGWRSVADPGHCRKREMPMNIPNPGDGALLVLPSRRVSARILPWRRLYDPEHWRLIPPHVTVAYPFVREAKWEGVRADLARAVAAFPPFWITLSGLNTFEDPHAVLWFRPDDGGMLLRIQAALATQFPNYVQDGPLGFVPHLTVGFFDSQEDMAAARSRIAAAWQPIRFRVKALTYMTLCPDGSWCVCDAIPLSSGRPLGGQQD